jgi:hypothetical protein
VATAYKFLGMKNDWDKTKSVQLQDGTVLTKGGDAAEMSDEEHEKLKSEGFKFRKDGEASNDSSDDAPSQPETVKDQLAQQAATSGAQHGTATDEGTKRSDAIKRAGN